MSRENLRKKGSEMEEMAAAYLTAQGVRILERNFRIREAEIDLIGRQNGTLLFIEVKARRKDGKSGSGAEAVGAVKQGRICRCADFYMHSKGIDPYSTSIRFDVIEIRTGQRTWNAEAEAEDAKNAAAGDAGQECAVRWIRDAFPYRSYKRTGPAWRVW